MHKYTLKFHNEILEAAFTAHQRNYQIAQMSTICKINIPMQIFLSIISACMEDYIASAISIGCLFNSIGVWKLISFVAHSKLIILHETFVFVFPPGAILFIYLSISQKEVGINVIIYLIIQVQIIITTPNIIIAIAQLIVNFIAVTIIIYIVYGWSLYILIWIPLFLFSLYNYHSQKRSQKLLFQQSQVNQSIITLIKETIVDDIMYFRLNRDLLKYELEFTNIENLDLSSFLSSIVINRKENIKQYLFSKINVNNITSDKHRVIGYINSKERVELEIYIQYYPELKFFIKIIKKSHPIRVYPEDEAKIMHSCYKKMISKIQSNPQRTNSRYFLKMLCSMYAQVQLLRIQQAPYYFQQIISQFDIIRVIKASCQNLNLGVYLTDDIYVDLKIDSQKITFETLIYLILRIISTRNTVLWIGICRIEGTVSVIFNFYKPINIQKLTNSKCLKNIEILQSLLSLKYPIIDKFKCVCFIDLPENISFK